MARLHHGRDLWDRASAFAEADSSAVVTQLGSWTAEKLFYVGSYLAQVTHTMTGNPRFPGGVIYVDPFCGNGICADKDSGKQFPGGALLAAHCRKQFRKLIMLDASSANVAALQMRLHTAQVASDLWLQVGDANNRMTDIVRQIPPRALTVAFLDPWSLGIHFSAIKVLAESRRVDLLILFPDAMDIDRNVNQYYYSRKSDRLDLAMGDDGEWRTVWDEVRERPAEARRQAMVEHYLNRLSNLGYRNYDAHAIGRGGAPLYRIVFASKDPLGLKLWKVAVSEDLYGQRSLFQ